MWSYRRLICAGLFLLGLNGCGFHPLYAPSSRAEFEPELAAIRVEAIPDRLGQILAISLRDSFNPSGDRVSARYGLRIALTTTRQDVGIRSDGTASRAEIDTTATFTLTELGSNRILLTSSARTVSGFDILTDDYATIVAEKDAKERSMHDLSDEIHTRLALFLLRDQAKG